MLLKNNLQNVQFPLTQEAAIVDFPSNDILLFDENMELQ